MSNPPRLARRLLRFLAPRELADALDGDLREGWVRRQRGDTGHVRAWLWYWKEVLQVPYLSLHRRSRRLGKTGNDGRPPDRLWTNLGVDVANAWRIASRRPGFALAIVLTLGLGIGANIAVFGFVEAVVLSPLPYEEPDELYSILERHTSGQPRLPSYPTFQDFRAEAEVFEDLAFARGAPLTFRTEDRTGLLLGSFVTDSFFETLGVRAEVGRVLTAADYRTGVEGAVVISHRAWRRWFGSDPGVLGQTVTINELAFTVVGVMPPSFAYPDWGADNDLWLPISHLPPSELAALNQRGFHADSRVVGRLRETVALPDAQRSLNRIAEQLATAYPEVSAGWTTAQLQSLKELEIRGVRSQLLVLWAAVLLVLLMCCLNLANLYLVQGSYRRSEYALRVALGAPRRRVLRQIAVETLSLTSAGGMLGVLIAHWGIGWARTGALADLPRIAEVGLDGPVLLFATLLSIGVALLFALLVARQVSGASVHDDLRGARGGTRRQTPLLSGIQAVQIGMTFVLLLGAWLLGETFLKLTRVDPGYDPKGMMVVPINPPSPTYDDEGAALDLYAGLLDAVQKIPGVSSVALTNHGPGGLAGAPTTAALGAAPRDPEQDLSVLYRTVSPAYFETLRTPMVAGREFTAEDLEGGEGPVIVNETLAARLGGGPAALGETVGVRKAASSRSDFGEPLRGSVVGVVSDLDTSERGGRPVPTVYVPYTHSPWSQVRLLVRAGDTSATMRRALEDAVWSLDPAIPLSGPFVSVRRLEDLRSAQRSRERLNAGLVGAFAAMALLLACVGMYGVISFMVVRREREIGVRMALGATPRRVAVQIVKQATLIGGVGLVGGVVAAVLLSSFIRSLLFQVSPLAVDRYLIVACMLLSLTAGAAYVPVRRASRTDPAVALRSD